MGVSAANAKRTDASAARVRIAMPLRELRAHVKRAVFEIDQRIRAFEMKARRNDFVLESENSFDQPGNARSGIQMADVGFYRPIAQRRVRAARPREKA